MIFRSLRRSNIQRMCSSVARPELPILNLEEHIQKYKTRKFADTYMDLDTLPEIGNELHNMSGTNGILWCYEAEDEAMRELMGPDQVSPHYENFTFSRKMGLTVAGVALAQLAFNNNGNILYAFNSAFYPFMFFFATWFFHLEMKKSTFAPILFKFYNQVGAHEIMSLVRNEAENYYSKWRNLESIAREQLEFLDLHKEFQFIKSEAVEKLLAAERSQLKQELQSRASSILSSAQKMESSNLRLITGRVLEVIKAEAARVKANPGQEVVTDSFQAALNGIRNGKMDYSGDLVLGKILAVAKKEIEGVNNLSEAEKKDLVELTQNQIQSIRNEDQMAQQKFLKKPPAGLDAVLRDNDSYSEVMSNW